MEAILEKKSPKMTGRWVSRLFRLKDRRLMYFKKDVTNFNSAIDTSAKNTLDLTHLISLTIDRKHDNILIVKHPMIDLALRFPTNELFMSWLKVLSTFTYISNGPKIEPPLPSNYLYSIFVLLQSLYRHPDLCKTEGIFRISASKKEKKLIYNSLLQQTYDINMLNNYKNIHILSNLLCSLLTNLPSTIFKEKRVENLIHYYDLITKEYHKNIQNNKTNCEKIDKENAAELEEKHVDFDVSNIPTEILNGLKLKIEELYLHRASNKHNYGIMTLIFHLLKQIILCELETKMTAESLSRIFVDLLESKIFLMKNSSDVMNIDINLMFRMKYLIKTLIYNAYFIFIDGEWAITDIVIANKCEIATINLYNQCKKLRHRKKNLSNKFMDIKKNIQRRRKNSLRKQSNHETKNDENDNEHKENLSLALSVTNQQYNGIPAEVNKTPKTQRKKKKVSFKLGRPKLFNQHSLTPRQKTIKLKTTKSDCRIDYKSDGDGLYSDDSSSNNINNDDMIEPIDINEFVSNINGFNTDDGRIRSENIYYENKMNIKKGKRNTDPPNKMNINLSQSARNSVKNIYNREVLDENDINDALYNFGNHDENMSPIPIGHSKDDTIITKGGLNLIQFEMKKIAENIKSDEMEQEQNIQTDEIVNDDNDDKD